MRLWRTLPALPLSTAACAAVPLLAYLWCATSSNHYSAACRLAAHEVLLHASAYRLHATCYCYHRPTKFRCMPIGCHAMCCCCSTASDSRPAKSHCVPIGCMQCSTAIPLPAITGPRFPLHAYSWHAMFHGSPIFSMQYAAARLFAACDALSQSTVLHLFAH